MGTVRDALTKAPLSGVTIRANDPVSPHTTIAGADGGFRLDHLTPANYRLKYTLPGYLGSDANGTELVYIRAGAVTERVTLELTPFARLEGTVLDEEGRPRIPETRGKSVGPGDYVLQVIVTDKLAKEKYRVATQSMDFEIQAAPPPQR